MEEIWKVIVDDGITKDKYAVSNLGNVKVILTNHVVPIQDNGFGYKKCAFSVHCNTLQRYVHRLVAIAFIPNPENLPQVGHKDHDKENNFVENLYWTSQSQNTRDGVKAGRINAKKRGKTNQLTLHQIKEIAFKRFGKMGVNEIAVSMGLPRTTVSSVINGRSHWDIYCSALKEAEVFLATLEEKN